MRNGLAEVGQLFFHQETGGGLANKFRNADDRGVSAVRGTERVANKQAIAKRRELARKFRVVGFLFGMEAHVFEQQHFPVTK